ncbi:MAG TPA: poly(A) polymerase [Firmicutes bacterium]|jgi:poly(A) polymerase/tRNA nucleotidyltransferase (CCA-adding enzyme)|nr:poly(A) polymerase [Bacillota bacterium]
MAKQESNDEGGTKMRLVIPPTVLRACEILTRHGYQAYLVGGAVRDSYLGLKPTDWDITTDAIPEDVELLFDRTIPTGKLFGTVTVLLEDTPLEITTMRSDGPYSDGRHPDYIAFTKRLEDDLGRRDFTINALAYDPLLHRTIDPFSGAKHLRKELLVTVGNPADRFQEDPLRMLRLVRFQSTLGFKIEKKTRLTLPELARLIIHVSPERILSELNKMLLGKELFLSLETLYTSGLMEQIIPELAAGYKVSAGGRHPYDLLGHAMATAHFAAPILTLKWAALLHDVGKLETLKRDHAQISARWAEKILRRLRASSVLTEKVSILIAHHMFAVHPHSSDREIRRFLAQVGFETAYELVKLRQADMAGLHVNPRQILSFGEALEARLNEVFAQEHALSVKDLCIDGHELMKAFDLKPGPLVGKILQHLLEQVWDDPSLNQPTQLKELAQGYLESLPQNRG